MKTLTIRRPDDWHVHLRDGELMRSVLPYTSAHFGRAIVMPNLLPPVVTVADARAYRRRIMEALPNGHDFEPLMTLYLTERTEPDDVEAGFREGDIAAVKLYPAGATTNSESGVRDIAKVLPVLDRMAEVGLPLCVHGEVTDPSVDIFDREAVFIESVLEPLRRRLPQLKIVLEHVTTSEGVDYVLSQDRHTAATITVHHLIINRNAILAGGIRPHYYCLPVAKREAHRLALRRAAVSGDPRFFLGTDSAPHVDPLKECACGCAGVFTAPNALSCLAAVFEEEQALDRLEGFASLHGPAFYELRPNEARMTLRRNADPVPHPGRIDTGEGPVTVFDPSFKLRWNMEIAAG